MAKSYWRWTVGILACLALVCSMVVILPVVRTAEAQDTKVFTILHTNDEHSELIPHNPASDYPDYPTTGGISRIAHELERIRAEKAAAGEPVLTLSAGDYNQGTPFGWLETQAAAELVIMQTMGYEAIAVGNHDFDMGVGYRYQAWNFAKTLPPAAGGPINIPLLCSNMSFNPDAVTYPDAALLKTLYSNVDKQGAELAIQPYTVKTLSNGLKVGIFGLLGVEAEAVAPAAGADGVSFGNVYNPDGSLDETMSFLNRVIRSQTMVNTLRDAGCDVVVALSHSGTGEEEELAEFVTGIDVIVGGHTHELTYPPVTVGDTTIVQAGAYTNYLGELELEYDGSKVSVRNATAIKIDESIPTVPAIDALIAQYVAGLDLQLNALLGGKSILDRTMETDLGGDGGFNLNVKPPLVETNLGDLITDAYRTITSALSTDGNPTQIAFEANGLIRGSIPRGGLGQFCFYDLVSAIPLGGSATDISAMGYSLVNFYLLGAELQGVLEGTLDMGMNDFFVQLSGARYSYRPAAPLGSKVTNFEVDDGAGGWQPLDPGALYKVATDYYAASFLAAFGVVPRTQAGVQDPNLNNFLVYYDPGPPAKEMRGWLALYQYIMGVGDLDGDGLANVPPNYAATDGRITAAGWYLAEGSTDGGMETFVLVQNPGDADVHVNVKFQTDTGEVAPDELQGISIPADSRVTFKANDWVTNFNVSTLVEPIDGEVICERAVYGNGRTWAHDSIGVTAPVGPAPVWYLAEGSTDGGMETFLLVQNPYASAAHVDIVFQTGSGEVAPPDLQGVEIPAMSRSTFAVNNYVTDYNVSTSVHAADGLVVCERAVYGDDRTWAHDSIGSSALGIDWYLAEGSTDGGMETYVLVQNPSDADAKVDVAFQTDFGDLAPVDLQGVVIPAGSRRTFKVNDYVTTYNVSTRVVCSEGAVVCERAMYGDGRTWAHDSIGATAPDFTWYLAEGSTDGGMETYVLVQNPNAVPVDINVMFQTDSGEVVPPDLQGVTIPANSRWTFKVNDWVTTFNVSTMVEATGGWVVCERAMYGDGRTWAHDSIGYAP